MRLFIPVLSILFASACTAGTGPSTQTQNFEFCGKKFKLELVKSEVLRTKGLMEREGLDAMSGMLFVFRDEALRSFWMKNVLIPLDIAFLDSRGRLINAHRMKVESPLLQDHVRKLYSSEAPAQFALEVAAGTFTQLPAAELKKCFLKPIPKIDSTVE